MRKFLVCTSIVMILTSGAAGAAETKTEKTNPSKPQELSKAQREQMAILHEKMAQCLRSEKSLQECHQELRAQCQEMIGTEGCPMMGMGQGLMKRGQGPRTK